MAEGELQQLDHILSRGERLGVFLSNSCRPDGREFDALRDISISPDIHAATSYGSSLVKWGKTLISCNVTFQVGTPNPRAPNEGSLAFDAALWSISSSALDSQRYRKSSDALLIESTLMKLYGNNAAFDTSQLCIEVGKRAFVLNVQVVCLSNDGGLLEASILAVSAALSRTVVPAVLIDSDMKVRVTSPIRSRSELPKKSNSIQSSQSCQYSKLLKVKRLFVGLSAGIVTYPSGENKLLIDPSLQECNVEKEVRVHGVRKEQKNPSLTGLEFLVIDNEGDICLVQNGISDGMKSAQLFEICDICTRKAKSEVVPLLVPLFLE